MDGRRSPYPFQESITTSFRNGLIDSPLQHWTDSDLNRKVKDFHQAKKLEDVLDLKLLKRGAWWAKLRRKLEDPVTNPQSPFDQSIPASGMLSDNSTLLTSEEKRPTQEEFEALKRERAGALSSLTKPLIIVLTTCAIGAIVQGWSQESIVGANLEWPLYMGIASMNPESSTWSFHQNKTIYFGLVNAIPYFSASILGAWVSDPITNKYGRRSALLLAGICSLISPIGAAVCQQWWQLLICRIILGIGMGAKSSVVPILESEFSPPKMRGRILVSWQTFVAVGICFGALANRIFQKDWRWQIGISFVPAVPLLCLCYVIPESPRWLMKKGQYKKAYLVLKDMRETPLQAARDLYLIYAQLKVETLLFSEMEITDDALDKLFIEKEAIPVMEQDFFSRVAELFTIARNRRAVAASCIAMTAQQFSGYNVFAFLATSIFVNTGTSNTTNLWITFALALANAVFSALAYLFIDKLGRRTLLLSSLILMFPFLFLSGHFLDSISIGNSPLGTVIPLVIIYAAFYSPGAGVIPFMYSAEVFPLVHREAGMSLACAVNFCLAGILALVTPLYSTSLSHKYLELLGTFAGLDAVAVVLVWLFMRSPEEAVSLEEMNFHFGAPSGRYLLYQVSVALPWVLRQPLKIFGVRNARKDSFDEWHRKSTSEYTQNRRRVHSEGTWEMTNGH